MNAAISNNLPTLSNEGGLSAYLDQIKKFPSQLFLGVKDLIYQE